NPLAKAARLTLDYLKTPAPNVKLIIQSDIPIASGLGSGAAITTVIIRAISKFCEQPLTNKEVNNLVYEIEKIYHGTPSGIDNTVIVYEEAIYFVRGEPVQHITNQQKIELLIADTGKAALTKVAVGDVRALYNTHPGVIQPIL